VNINKELHEKINKMQNQLKNVEEELAESRRDFEALKRRNTDYEKEPNRNEEGREKK
jgi:hypothetical protein